MSSENQIEIIGLKNIPLIKKGDDIVGVICSALKSNNRPLIKNDIIIIAQKIISKSIGRVMNLDQIKPSERAIEIFNNISFKAKSQGLPIKDPRLIQAILDESKEILKEEHVIIPETKHGFVCANAGIDKSNIEGGNRVLLLPENPDEIAEQIRKNLKKKTNKDVAIIISDSFGRPFRVGAIGVAIGVSGISPILDKRGEKDLFDHELQTTIIGQADSLASAAQLVMGEANEGLPVVIIRGYEFELNNTTTIKPILRKKDIDLFRHDKESISKNMLKNRRSYKLPFDEKIVDKKIIEDCINLARWAPSAHNGQFWRYIILEKGPLRNKLIKQMNEKLRNDLEKEGKSNDFIETKIEKTRYNFLDAPFLILLCMESKDFEVYSDSERAKNENILGVQSVSSSATYLLLAFHLNNLVSCWYCAPLFAKEIIIETLKLPKTFIPMAFFTVGYPIKSVKPPPRKSLNEVIFDINT